MMADRMQQPDRFTVAVEVSAQAFGPMRKLAAVRLKRPGQPAPTEVYSLVSDEGPHLGGEGSAPTPLTYFVAGVAF